MAQTLTIGDAVIELTRGDITREAVDAIVNAANSSLMGGGGVDGAIHRAGGPSILEECRAIVADHGRCATGKAVITSGGKLKARRVIHAVGPCFGRPGGKDAELLASAYRESLRLADEAGCVSVAFPAISTGAYGYPLDEAARVALGAVCESLRTSPSVKLVRFVLFDEAAFRAFEDALSALPAQ